MRYGEEVKPAPPLDTAPVEVPKEPTIVAAVATAVSRSAAGGGLTKAAFVEKRVTSAIEKAVNSGVSVYDAEKLRQVHLDARAAAIAEFDNPQPKEENEIKAVESDLVVEK